jgi:hypothetical protein
MGLAGFHARPLGDLLQRRRLLEIHDRLENGDALLYRIYPAPFRTQVFIWFSKQTAILPVLSLAKG